MAKIAFNFKQETIEKFKIMFPNETNLHEMLESNNSAALDCLFNLSRKFDDLIYEINTSTVEG